jgi:hypothetical protein
MADSRAKNARRPAGKCEVAKNQKCKAASQAKHCKAARPKNAQVAEQKMQGGRPKNARRPAEKCKAAGRKMQGGRPPTKNARRTDKTLQGGQTKHCKVARPKNAQVARPKMQGGQTKKCEVARPKDAQVAEQTLQGGQTKNCQGGRPKYKQREASFQSPIRPEYPNALPNLSSVSQLAQLPNNASHCVRVPRPWRSAKLKNAFCLALICRTSGSAGGDAVLVGLLAGHRSPVNR